MIYGRLNRRIADIAHLAIQRPLNKTPPRKDRVLSIPRSPRSVSMSHTPPHSQSSERAAKKPKLDSTSQKSNNGQARRQPKKTGRRKRDFPSELYGSEDVLWRDIVSLLGDETVQKLVDEEADWKAPIDLYESGAEGGRLDELDARKLKPFEMEVNIVKISHEGRGLGISTSPDSPNWVYVVPFALEGEMVKCRVYRHSRLHSYADFIEVVSSPTSDSAYGSRRDSSLPKCRYFTICGGCQYQMLPYETQLNIKRDILVNAYRQFFATGKDRMVAAGEGALLPDGVPEIGTVVGSPLEYGYRTKITPHFDAPPKSALKKANEKSAKGWDPASNNLSVESVNNEFSEWSVRDGLQQGKKPSWFNIGFTAEGKRTVLDVEECPIAPIVINEQYKKDRADISKKIYTYKKGVTLLYRDSLDPKAKIDIESSHVPPSEKLASLSLQHLCETSQKGTNLERVGHFLFEYTAGSFFQNNNVALPRLVDYVKDCIFGQDASSFSPENSSSWSFPASSFTDLPTHLVDAYCGSGFFSISLAPYFSAIKGIELSEQSIKSANQNITLNTNLYPGLKLEEKMRFTAGDATNIFQEVRHGREIQERDIDASFPSSKTVLIIDPPRKGCSLDFLKQLMDFLPHTVVYVSCNAVTQARDVGMILNGCEAWNKEMPGWAAEKKGRYTIESVRGFDLFPQTAHVESVALLRLKTPGS